MKRNYLTIILLLALFFTIATRAQSKQKNFINYQGVARNAESKLMANETMTIGIALKFGGSTAITAYEETHLITTDANGVFSLKIGDGTPTHGKYDALHWGKEAVYLTTSLNDKILGTTEMMAVPYAISSGDADDQSASEVPYNNTISGLKAVNTQEAIDELVGSGSVDADADPTNEIQTLSFDVATNEISLTDGGKITIPTGGTDADADPTNEFQILSFNTTTNELALSDGNAVTIPSGGTDADADPTNEIQTLSFDVATNEISLTDGGKITIPSGGTDADADPTNEFQTLSFNTTTNELALSDGNAITIPSGGTDADADPINEIQTLSFDVATNEISLTDGGKITIPTGGTDADADPTNEIDVTEHSGLLLGDGDLVTGLVGTADGQVAKWDATIGTWIASTDETGGGTTDNSTGLEAIDEGNGTGWRLKGVDTDNYGPIGKYAIDLSFSDDFSTSYGATGPYSYAAGSRTTASGDNSTAKGQGTVASGDYSTAMGHSSVASGDYSTAMGVAVAVADYSTAIGQGTVASGESSTTMGSYTEARALSSLAIGQMNISGGSATNWVDEDPLFEIGNGSLSNGPHNAFTVLKNGNVGIGEHQPVSLLEVAHGNNGPTPSNRTNAFSIKNLNTGGSWQFHTSGGGLLLAKDGEFRGAFVGDTGEYTTVSDRKVKRDIIPLKSGTLHKVLRLNPVSYLMKNQKDTKRNLGLISQEVQEIFPSLTEYVPASDLLSLSYTELIPILIKAVQEQQAMIVNQNSKINTLSAEVSEIKTLLENLKSKNDISN
ncbi:hypothetical protein GH721_03600 [Kriegella sp. EG-1]|nr:hypothetical protein [Flavobacteriaceae bacterium EG-1]